MLKLFVRLRYSNSGVAAMEYGLIAGLVGSALLVAGGVFFGNATGGSAGSLGSVLAKTNAAISTAVASIP